LKPELLLAKAINTLNRWNEDLLEEDEHLRPLYSANVAILEYSLLHVDNRKSPVVRNAIALAYAVLGIEDV
jgi:hypothetical protein